MGRILAIDYGYKRSGVAVSDPLRIIANGLDTIPTHKLLDFIDNYLKVEQVTTIVIGLPKQMSGAESETMSQIRPFKRKLEEKYPETEIVYADERFTSVLAQKAMLDGGLKKKARQNKALVDKISATIILQGYMESLNPW